MGLFPPPNGHHGVLKTPHEKSGFPKYAGIYFAHIWKLIELNFLYCLFCIPIITIGPATAAMTKICRNYSQERPASVWSDFWQAFKANFKQGLVFGLLNTVLVVIFAVGVPFYMAWAKEMPLMYAPLFISLAFMLVMIMMNFYSFIMISSTNLTVKQIFKNSLILIYLGLKKSLICLFVYVILMSASVLFFPISLMVVIFIPFTLISFINCALCYPVVRKYIIQPYYDQLGEENPELAYLDTHDERVFKDTPEYETASQAKAKRKKKKVVK